MDLLREAGHDVDYWRVNADGSQVARPAANPNYCYNWSFGSPTEGIVLCIWHGSLKIDGDRLAYAGNMHSLDNDLSIIAASVGHEPKDRDRARQQATRARSFDALVRLAFEKLLPVRFIINEGNVANRSHLGSKSSTVSQRALDSEQWYVHKYNEHTGDCFVVRGVRPTDDKASYDDPDDDYRRPEDERQRKAIQTRRGQRDFRDRLLAAWKRQCVVTGSRVEGLLEAAHITPHAEQTDYRTSNGLLLRADIHTLYDLDLLSIDEYMQVHLNVDVQHSEYRQYAGKRIERRPDASSDAPSQEALKRRHAKFQSGQARGTV